MVFLLALLLAQVGTSEVVTVRRVNVNARIVDPYGKPILGLKPADFDVIFGDEHAQVVSVTWVPETAAGRAMVRAPEFDYTVLDAIAQSGGAFEDEGRLFVFLFQKDLALEGSRIGGQLHFLPYVEKIVNELPENDRVAIFSFDSHLRFRLDFTRNKSEVRAELKRVFLRAEPLSPPSVEEPSLALCLDRKAMFHAATMEQALLVLARALEDTGREPQVIIFGHGFGDNLGQAFTVAREWDTARKIMVDSGVTVNSIYTNLNAGRLMNGLVRASTETGGFFKSAVSFPQQAVDRVSKGELAGHYELELRPPDDLGTGNFDIELRVPKQQFVYRATVTITE